MTELVIHAQGLSKQFGNFFAVERLDLRVPRGTIYGFLGPNGCGKTTAMRMLTGLLTPSQGTVSVLGLEIPKHAEQLKQSIGYMTQKFSYYNDLSVAENLSFCASVYCVSANEAKQRISEQISHYGLDSFKNRLVSGLSGGQRQRVALACATLHRPELLFLDEPTSAVDPENRRNFWEKLFDLSDQGTTILVSTHYMDEAERCHKIAILERGIKRADDSPEELMANLGATVVEATGHNLRDFKRTVAELTQVKSTAQLGNRLRILVDKQCQDPVGMIAQHSRKSDPIEFAVRPPSLEDVFVMVTGDRGARP